MWSISTRAPSRRSDRQSGHQRDLATTDMRARVGEFEGPRWALHNVRRTAAPLALVPALVLALMLLSGCGPQASTAGGTRSGLAAAAGRVGAVPNGAGAPSAKRTGPPEVPSVKIGKLRFEALQWGKDRGYQQNGGYVAALDAATGKELWTLKVYEVTYQAGMEGDVQDIFIKSLGKSLFGGKLKVEDERGRIYIVDPETRTVEAR
jgi:hypothetical protein